MGNLGNIRNSNLNSLIPLLFREFEGSDSLATDKSRLSLPARKKGKY
jgi:hypothetical protein